MKTFHVDEPKEIGKRKDRLSSKELMMVKDELTEKVIKGKLREFVKKELSEAITIPIEIGDTVLGGKFKNKKMVVKSIGKNEKGDNRKSLTVIEDMIRVAHRNPGYLSRIEQSLVSFLLSDATVASKRVIGKYFSVIANDSSAEPVSSLLDDPELFETALYILERISDEPVNVLLREKLSAVNDNIKVSIINTLGSRQDENAVSKLKEYIRSNNPDIATASATALGNIGTWKAAKVLKKSMKQTTGNQRQIIVNAYLKCGNLLLQTRDLKKAKKIFTHLSRPQ